jgi:hypothetical protein
VIKIHLEPITDELRLRYEECVLVPGKRWLAANNEQRPRPYWREVQTDLANAFHLRCAYTAMWLNYSGTLDHFVSIDEDRSKAYDWDNFRYCDGRFNSKKRSTRSHELLDPLCVEDGWFELSLPDLQLHITTLCPEHLRNQAEFMLEKLGLRNGEPVMRSREAYLRIYQEHGESALPIIERLAPLVARAIRKDLERRAAAVTHS